MVTLPTYMLSLTSFPQNITSWGIEAVLEAASIALRTILKTNSALKHNKQQLQNQKRYYALCST